MTTKPRSVVALAESSIVLLCSNARTAGLYPSVGIGSTREPSGRMFPNLVRRNSSPDLFIDRTGLTTTPKNRRFGQAGPRRQVR